MSVVCAIIRCDHLPWSGPPQVKLNLLIGNHEEIRSKTGMSTSTVQSWVLASSSRCSMYIRMCYMCSMYVTYLSA